MMHRKHNQHFPNVFAAAVACLCVLWVGACEEQSSLEQNVGSFVGKLLLEHVDGQTKRVVNELVFIDRNERRWIAPAGLETDGASIPASLWSVVGGPFAGNYVMAAVVHDFYCLPENHDGVSPREVHRMFYEACLSAGVSENQAKVMYTAVYYFGPWWGDEPRSLPDGYLEQIALKMPPLMGGSPDVNPSGNEFQAEQEAYLRRVMQQIETQDPTLNDIEQW